MEKAKAELQTLKNQTFRTNEEKDEQVRKAQARTREMEEAVRVSSVKLREAEEEIRRRGGRT